MRCEYCRAVCTEYESGYSECGLGISEDSKEFKEWKDGEYGCTLHPQTVKKLLRQKDETMEISAADAQKMLNPEEYERRLIRMEADERHMNQMLHAIGIDNGKRIKTYKRHGRKFYKAYRNYFCIHYNNEIWSNLRYLGFASCDTEYWEKKAKENGLVCFSLTRDGLKLIEDRYQIVIKIEN